MGFPYRFENPRKENYTKKKGMGLFLTNYYQTREKKKELGPFFFLPFLFFHLNMFSQGLIILKKKKKREGGGKKKKKKKIENKGEKEKKGKSEIPVKKKKKKKRVRRRY